MSVNSHETIKFVNNVLKTKYFPTYTLHNATLWFTTVNVRNLTDEICIALELAECKKAIDKVDKLVSRNEEKIDDEDFS